MSIFQSRKMTVRLSMFSPPPQTVFNPFLSPFRWVSSIHFLRKLCHLDDKNPCCKIVQAFKNKKLITSTISHFCFLFLTFSTSRITESNL